MKELTPRKIKGRKKIVLDGVKGADTTQQAKYAGREKSFAKNVALVNARRFKERKAEQIRSRARTSDLQDYMQDRGAYSKPDLRGLKKGKDRKFIAEIRAKHNADLQTNILARERMKSQLDSDNKRLDISRNDKMMNREITRSENALSRENSSRENALNRENSRINTIISEEGKDRRSEVKSKTNDWKYKFGKNDAGENVPVARYRGDDDLELYKNGIPDDVIHSEIESILSDGFMGQFKKPLYQRGTPEYAKKFAELRNQYGPAEGGFVKSMQGAQPTEQSKYAGPQLSKSYQKLKSGIYSNIINSIELQPEVKKGKTTDADNFIDSVLSTPKDDGRDIVYN